MKSKMLKAGILVAAAVVLVVATVLTTMAFLASSFAVSNTFTVGNVSLTMYESYVDANGQIDTTKTPVGTTKNSEGNTYELIPGKSYVKDPTIYVKGGSVKSLIFVKVRNQIETIECGNVIGDGGIATTAHDNHPSIKEQMAIHGWQLVGATATGDIYVYSGAAVQADLSGDALAAIEGPNFVNATVIPSSSETQAYDVFDMFTVDPNAKELELFAGAKVTITAFSIQADTFVADVAAGATRDEVVNAWSAIVNKFPYESGSLTNN